MVQWESAHDDKDLHCTHRLVDICESEGRLREGKAKTFNKIVFGKNSVIEYNAISVYREVSSKSNKVARVEYNILSIIHTVLEIIVDSLRNIIVMYEGESNAKNRRMSKNYH